MWGFLLLIGFLSLSIGNAEDCGKAMIPCLEFIPEKDAFPRTSQEFKDFCTKIIDLNKCLYNAWESCKEDFPPELHINPSYFPTSIKNITEVCTEGTSINKALNKHLKCYADVFQTKKDTCIQVASEAMQKGGITNPADQIYTCSKGIIAYACVFKEIGQTCGDEAESTAFHVTQLLKSQNDFCTAYSMHQLEQKLAALGLDEATSERLRDMLKALEKDETFPIEFN